MTDASGAVIPNAEVTAKNVNTGITSTSMSNAKGDYQFPSLQPGEYSISSAGSG